MIYLYLLSSASRITGVCVSEPATTDRMCVHFSFLQTANVGNRYRMGERERER